MRRQAIAFACLPQIMRGHFFQIAWSRNPITLHQRLHRLSFIDLPTLGRNQRAARHSRGVCSASAVDPAQCAEVAVRMVPAEWYRPNGTGTGASIYAHAEQILEPSVIMMRGMIFANLASDRGLLHNK